MNRNQAREKAQALVAKMTVEEAASQLRYDAPEIEHLGIPAYNWWNEALHGVARAGLATVFPQPIGMAASFDTDAVYNVYTAAYVYNCHKQGKAVPFLNNVYMKRQSSCFAPHKKPCLKFPLNADLTICHISTVSFFASPRKNPPITENIYKNLPIKENFGRKIFC